MLRIRTTSQEPCLKLLETNKCIFAMIYKLLKLTLLLSVTTTNVERVFSAMKVVKSKLCKKRVFSGIIYILLTVSDYVILAHFQ